MSQAAALVAQLAAAGTPPELLAAVAQELFAGEAERRILAERRQNEKDRKARSRSVTGQDGTGGDTEPQKEKSPTPPKEKHTNPTPKGVCPKRGSRLPDDFEVPAEWIDYAVGKRRWSPGEAAEEAEIFCRHWQAATGPNSTKRNWFKAWQNWVVKSYRKDGALSSVAATLTPAEHRQRAAFFTSIGNDEKAREHLHKAELGVAAKLRTPGPPKALGGVASDILRQAGRG